MPSELDILDRLRRRTPRAKGLTLGIGDDCAIYRPTPGEELVFTTDFYLEDVHFQFDSHTPAQIGHNVLARGLSDIASMGAQPRFCLLSLALSSRTGQQWVNSFYSGLLKLAAATGTALAGGDLALDDKIHCDIVVCGGVPRGSAILRSGARPRDKIYVSGTLGGSALRLANGKKPVSIQPRITLGEFLRKKLHATACMDLSDGLSLDLKRLCLESGVSAAIAMPLKFSGASDEQALSGGEDYELLFTVRPHVRVPDFFESLPLTQIGEITAGKAGRVLLDGKLLKASGFDHFKNA